MSKDSIDMLSNEIRGERNRLGLSQQQFAEKFGLSQELISKLERGKIAPRTRSLFCLFSAVLKRKNQDT